MRVYYVVIGGDIFQKKKKSFRRTDVRYYFPLSFAVDDDAVRE